MGGSLTYNTFIYPGRMCSSIDNSHVDACILILFIVASSPIIDEARLLDLLNFLHSVAYKWKEIGLALGFPMGELNNIEHTWSFSVQGPSRYLTELIQQWLGWAPPDHKLPNDEDLIEALQSPNVGEQVLADQLLMKS